ncbi:MAG: fibronectin type III domain-containing protein, partial [Elusimicrobia bacterium]|nr:fibronectin type III domain-containing protein [Elusimicrobiota bacterium]
WPGTATSINSLSWSLPTSSAPAAVTSLAAVTGSSPGEIDLTWTAPGDDGTTGTISLGEFRVKYSSMSDASDKGGWDYASNYISSVCANISLSKTYTMNVTGLLQYTTYYFRVWTADEQPNWSAVSNEALARTPSNLLP